VERQVRDRLELIAQPLRAQVAEGLATGVCSRNAAHLVSRDTLVRSNAAKHQGFHSDVLISEVPVRVLRHRQRGDRKKEGAKEADDKVMEVAESQRFKEQVAEEEAMRQVAVEKAAVQQAADERAAEEKIYFEQVLRDQAAAKVMVDAVEASRAKAAEEHSAKVEAEHEAIVTKVLAKVGMFVPAAEFLELVAKEKKAAELAEFGGLATEVPVNPPGSKQEQEKAAEKPKSDKFDKVDLELEALAQRINHSGVWEGDGWRRQGWR
jgi:hypothetical protein